MSDKEISFSVSVNWIYSCVLIGLYAGFLAIRGSQAVCASHSSSDAVRLSEWSGSIESPGLDTGQYPHGQDCRWDIVVSQGSKISLTFDILRIEEGFYGDGSPLKQKTCFDFVQIEGYGDQAQTLCGDVDAPISLTSRGNAMSILFHSDDAIHGLGFRATYKGVCGGEITEDSVISSPGYPHPPPDGATCSWTIKHTGHMTSVIRALGVGQRVQRPEDLDKFPPRCGLSPFKLTTRNFDGEGGEGELCLLDSVDASVEEVILTYATSEDVQPWVGQLSATFQDEVSCKSVCMNSVGCADSTRQPINGVLDYTCDCVDGFTGKNCEVEIALAFPCSVQSCEQGVCENLPELGRRKCTCFPGYTGESCENALVTASPDACVDVTCRNGGVCIPLGPHAFVCDCPDDSGFIGKLCNIPVGSGYCQQEVDSFPGSVILWIDTPVGVANFQLCPGTSQGNASRFCIPEKTSLTGGAWTRPDLSQCVSPAMYRLSQDAKRLLDTTASAVSSPVAAPASILDITSRLANITQAGLVIKDARRHGLHHELYPGDLILSADVIKTVTVATQRTIFVQTEDAVDLTHQYTMAVDNLVDPRTENTWKNARSDLVGAQVSTVVESTQSFLTSLFLQRPAFGQRMASLRQNGVGMSNAKERMIGNIYRLASRNIDIYLTKYDQGSMTGPRVLFGGNTSSVGFSTAVLDEWSKQTRTPATIYVARFQSIARLLSFADDRMVYNSGSTNLQAAASTSVVNSDVITASVLNVPRKSYSNIRRPIVLTFSLQDPRLSQNLTKKCVFMNMSSTSYTDRWSGRGCVVGQSNDTHVVCYCYHLTNFAVLMDVYETQESLDNGNDTALTYISYIGSILSILGCLVTIITFQYLGLNNDRVRIHQQLGASIVLVQVLFICIGVTGQEYGTPLWGCRTLAIGLHYCLTAMFCWMLVEGVHLYVVLVHIFDLGSHFKKYLAVGWGVPLVVVGISVSIFYDRYGTSKLCWLDHELLLVCFVPAVGLVILINTVILGVVIRIMISSNQLTDKINQQERNSMKTSLKATGVLLPLLGLTWVLGFLSVDTGGRHVMTYVFTYLFTLTNSFQGVLFFIFHCLLNVDVHLAYERRFKLKKRLSYAETISSRARKLSEPDFFSPHRLLTNSKSTITTRSTLTNLSLGGDTRSSQRDKDREPIIVDEVDKLPRLSMPWTNFNPSIIPEPDYPHSHHNHHHHNHRHHDAFHNNDDDDLDDNIFHSGSKTPSTTSSSRKRLHTDSELGSDFMQMPRAQRTSVRFT